MVLAATAVTPEAGAPMDTHARLERIEKRLAMDVARNQPEELPLPERFRKRLEWAEAHLSPAAQAWLYQPWPRALESPKALWKNPLANQPPELVCQEYGMTRVRVAVEVTRRTSIEFEVEDEADTEDIKETALDEAELAEWEEDPPEVISIDIIEPSA
jgi:hypothetical protein